MKAYSIAIVVCAILIIIANILICPTFSGLTHLGISLTTIGFVFLMFTLDLLIALLLHELPKLFFKDFMGKTRFYKSNRFPFKTYKFERRFYEKIKIRKWKDKLPNQMGMKKDKLEDKEDVDYLHRFMIESCRAEFMHAVSALVSAIIIFLVPVKYFPMLIPVVVVNIILQILPVLVQRYNRPKLAVLIKRNQRNIAEEKTEIKQDG